MEDEGYAPRQYSRDGGLQEATDFRSLAKSLDKSSIPNRDPGHASGGKRKRDETQAAPQVRAARGHLGSHHFPAASAPALTPCRARARHCANPGCPC